MPIYEYECKKCKAHTEVFQKMTDKPPTKCRKCGGRLEKQWSPTSFQFKGTGWYVTDYASKKTEPKEGKEEKSGAPTDATTGAGSGASKESPIAKESSSGEKSSSAGEKKSSEGEKKGTQEKKISAREKKSARSSNTSGD
jgi:putative FmdB family regulatory protein